MFKWRRCCPNVGVLFKWWGGSSNVGNYALLLGRSWLVGTMPSGGHAVEWWGWSSSVETRLGSYARSEIKCWGRCSDIGGWSACAKDDVGVLGDGSRAIEVMIEWWEWYTNALGDARVLGTMQCWRWSSNVYYACFILLQNNSSKHVRWMFKVSFWHSCQMFQSESDCIVSRNKECFVPLRVVLKIALLLNRPDSSHHRLYYAALYSGSSRITGQYVVPISTCLFVQAQHSCLYCR